jgi:hypothetical protein
MVETDQVKTHLAGRTDAPGRHLASWPSIRTPRVVCVVCGEQCTIARWHFLSRRRGRGMLMIDGCLLTIRRSSPPQQLS